MLGRRGENRWFVKVVKTYLEEEWIVEEEETCAGVEEVNKEACSSRHIRVKIAVIAKSNLLEKKYS